MSVLTANLKHLYQRRGLWLVYVVLGFLVFVSIAVSFKSPAVGQGRFIGLVVLAFVIGLIAALLPIEIMTKSFSYCLPGHRKVVRRFIFWVGVVVNLFGSLLFIMYPDLHSGQLVLVVCSAFFAGLIFYWLGVRLAFSIRSSAIGLLPLVMIGGGFFGLHKVIERAIVGNPFGVILVGVLSSVLAWFWLGNADLARRYCCVPWMGLFDAWNLDKVQKYSQVRMAKKWDKLKQHPSPWVETFFLGRMNRYDYFSTGRYIWGALYKTFGIALSQWKSVFSVLFMAVVMVCFLGYMGHMGPVNILFFTPGMMVAQMRLPVYSSMLISGGRNERFRCAVILVVAVALLITILLTIIAALSVLLATIMPDITLRVRNLVFQAMNIKLFFVPLLMIPIVFTVQLFFYRKPMFMMLLIMLVFVMLFFTLISWHEQLISGINPMFIIGGLVLSWGTFLLVSRYICMRRSLIGQG